MPRPVSHVSRLWSTNGATNTSYEYPDIPTLDEPMSYYGPGNPYPGQPDPYQYGSYGWNPQRNKPRQASYPPSANSPYMPVPLPGTLPLRPLGLGDYFTSMFAMLRQSSGLFFGAALIFGSISALLSATRDFFFPRSLTGDWINLYGELDSLISQTLVWSLLTSFLSLALLLLGQTITWVMFSTMVDRGAVGQKTLLIQDVL